MQISDIKEITPLIAAAIAALATLLAVLITSTFNFKTAKLNNKTQNQQKTKEIKLSKIEDLYLLFDKWQINFSNVYLLHYRCYKGKLTYTQVLDETMKLDLLAPGDYQKYKMIMAVHYPSLLNDYKVVENARSLLSPFLSDPNESRLSASDFEKLQIHFEKQAEEFKIKISSLAHRILDN